METALDYFSPPFFSFDVSLQTVLGRKGKAVIHTPLSVNSATTRINQPKKCASGHDQSTEEDLNADEMKSLFLLLRLRTLEPT